MIKRNLLNVFVVSLALSHFSAHAATPPGASATGNVSVKIQKTIQIDEDDIVDFGHIPDADGTCSMNAVGTLSGDCSGDGQPGSFTVEGTPGGVVDVTVTAGSSVDGVTFTPLLGSPGSPTLDALSGETTVTVSGNLVLNGATTGTKALQYTLTVNYQ